MLGERLHLRLGVSCSMSHRVAVMVVVLGVAALAGYACSLYTRPEPYIPPPLTLQGTKPDPHHDEDAGP